MEDRIQRRFQGGVVHFAVSFLKWKFTECKENLYFSSFPTCLLLHRDVFSLPLCFLVSLCLKYSSLLSSHHCFLFSSVSFTYFSLRHHLYSGQELLPPGSLPWTLQGGLLDLLWDTQTIFQKLHILPCFTIYLCIWLLSQAVSSMKLGTLF